jgi:hypothetical protein
VAEHGASSIECLIVYMVYWQSCYFSIRNSGLQIIQKMVHRFLYQHNSKTVLGCRVISILDFWTVAILSDPIFVKWLLDSCNPLHLQELSTGTSCFPLFLAFEISFGFVTLEF